MELKEINEQEYLKYALKNKYVSIYQLPGWGTLKKQTGWNNYLLGLFDDKTIKGVTLLLEKHIPFKQKIYYAPRGFLLDDYNDKLISEFTKGITEFIKLKKGVFLKIDPNVIYEIIKNEQESNVIGKEIHLNLINLGYKHHGFTKNFETMQPRNLCRFEIRNTYEETLNSFTKSTRKNIEKAELKGVKTREINETEIAEFVNILSQSAMDNKFIIRPKYYYEEMYKNLKDYIKLYITYIDVKEYKNNLKKMLNEANKDNTKLKLMMEKDHVGHKLTVRKEQIDRKINNIKNEIKDADNLEEDFINIGALMSIFIGDEGITFMSGTNKKYRDFNPKYSYYDAHIKECILEKKKYCNFYGISSDLDKNSKYYQIYEIKKGYNPEIVSLLGEYDLIFKKGQFILYKIMIFIYRIIKKVALIFK